MTTKFPAVCISRETLLTIMKKKIPITLGDGEEVIVVDVPKNPDDRGIKVVPKSGGKKKTVYLTNLI